MRIKLIRKRLNPQITLTPSQNFSTSSSSLLTVNEEPKPPFLSLSPLKPGYLSLSLSPPFAFHPSRAAGGGGQGGAGTRGERRRRELRAALEEEGDARASAAQRQRARGPGGSGARRRRRGRFFGERFGKSEVEFGFLRTLLGKNRLLLEVKTLEILK